MAGSFVPRGSFHPGHFPQVLRLAAVLSRSSTLQCPQACSLQLMGGCMVEAVSEVEVDGVSRCSTSVWTADTAAPLCLCALKSTIYALLCRFDVRSSPLTVLFLSCTVTCSHPGFSDARDSSVEHPWRLLQMGEYLGFWIKTWFIQ